MHLTALSRCNAGGWGTKRAALLAAVLLSFAVWATWTEPFPNCYGCARPTGDWPVYQRQLAKEASGDKRTKLDIVFLGDSITESYRGTSAGSRECSEFRCKGIPEVFHKEFGDKETMVLAISGDQTAHLRWRMRNGEGAAVKKARAAVVLIGTNDLSALLDVAVGGWKAPKKDSVTPELTKATTATLTASIAGVVSDIRKLNPSGKVVLLGLLPRGPSFRPPAFAWPNGIYTEVISQVNHNLARTYQEDSDVSFVECSEPFIDTAAGQVKKGLMPDSLHPSDRGTHEVFACVKDALKAFGIIPGSVPARILPAAT
eukprot:TRINITY_DN15800_c0_g1_i1.p2 TRINITY_DN15800_c0_g1~~TRINITY_DN15800_c0_g1_i1.p2  ORF type:complete len:315 (+),score=85.41 TRINITY_DN15800_c0_g1_i1:390-1334(+)